MWSSENPSEAVALARLAVALLVGLLVGLDRERSELRKGKQLLGGIRTFPLIALLGGLTGLAPPAYGVWPLVTTSTAIGALVLVSYVRSSAQALGATTEVAALVTFVLGLWAGRGALVSTAAVGVTVAVLLTAKVTLERFSRAMSKEELSATLEFAVISAIVLPLLPNRSFGPYGGLNPFEIWLVVVLVSAVSFAGFIAMRLWGAHRGLLLAALVGALVSSTAVTMAMAERSRNDPENGRLPAAGAVLASTIMCVRVAILAVAFGNTLLPGLWPALGAMTAAGLIACALLLRRRKAEQTNDGPSLANPFHLKAAATFGLIYGAAGLLVRLANHVFGDTGTLIAAALAAVVDVDAISISLARQASHGASGPFAAAVVIAAITNTLVKGGIALVGGRGRFRGRMAIALGAMALAGGAALGVTLLAL